MDIANDKESYTERVPSKLVLDESLVEKLSRVTNIVVVVVVVVVVVFTFKVVPTSAQYYVLGI